MQESSKLATAGDIGKDSLSLQANGHFSKKTEALVRRLQEDMDEEVTGVASPLLWEALMESHRIRSDLPSS